MAAVVVVAVVVVVVVLVAVVVVVAVVVMVVPMLVMVVMLVIVVVLVVLVAVVVSSSNSSTSGGGSQREEERETNAEADIRTCWESGLMPALSTERGRGEQDDGLSVDMSAGEKLNPRFSRVCSPPFFPRAFVFSFSRGGISYRSTWFCV